MKNKVKLGVAALLTSTLLVGCSLKLSPNELVKSPKMEMNQAEVKQAVEQYLPHGAKLTIPLRPSKASTFKQVDLDGDGQDEVVAFYKNEQNNYELGVLVLEKKQNQWKLRTQLSGLGQGIDYADFHDLTGDKIPEMLIGWSGGGMNSDLEVYTFQNKTINKIGQYSYVDFSVGDLDSDDKADLAVLLRNDKEIPTAELQLYQVVDGELTQTGKLEYEAVYPEQVTIGNAAKERKGIFVDVIVGAHAAYTQLVFLEKGQLKNVLHQEKDDFPITFKAYPLPSEDMDGDEIVEIGMQIEPPGTEEMAMVEIPWVNQWYKWDGKDELVPVMQEYADYGEGYRFDIPQNWKGKFTVKRTFEYDNIKLVGFYYIGKSNKPLEPLFTIDYVSKENWARQEDSLRQGQVDYLVLGENSEKIFVGILPSEQPKLIGNALQEYKQMILSHEQIKQGFKMISR